MPPAAGERHYIGLKQVEVCERLGVNLTIVSRYETGERRVGLIELRAVCEALDTGRA